VRDPGSGRPEYFRSPHQQSIAGRLARTRSTYIALLIAAVAFFFIGNLGGKNGNPTWLLAPVCILTMIVLGIVAFAATRRQRSGSR
jgi:hypothetical protein